MQVVLGAHGDCLKKIRECIKAKIHYETSLSKHSGAFYETWNTFKNTFVLVSKFHWACFSSVKNQQISFYFMALKEYSGQYPISI